MFIMFIRDCKKNEPYVDYILATNENNEKTTFFLKSWKIIQLIPIR
jgi:hypothetical protein